MDQNAACGLFPTSQQWLQCMSVPCQMCVPCCTLLSLFDFHVWKCNADQQKVWPEPCFEVHHQRALTMGCSSIPKIGYVQGGTASRFDMFRYLYLCHPVSIISKWLICAIWSLEEAGTHRSNPGQFYRSLWLLPSVSRPWQTLHDSRYQMP